MAERIPGIADRCLVTVVKMGGEGSVPHVEGLLYVRQLADVVDALSVYVQVKVDKIEGLQDITDPAAAIEVEGAIKDYVLCFEGFGGGDEADHTIGYCDAGIMWRVNGVSADGPGVCVGCLCLGTGCEDAEDYDEYICASHGWV